MNDIQIQMSDELIKEIGNAIAAYGIIVKINDLKSHTPSILGKILCA